MSGPVINILDTDDIVLAKIASGLHLDEFEIDLAGVGQSVIRADRQVNGFVLVHEMDAAIERHFRGAADDNPVFRPMLVFLQ